MQPAPNPTGDSPLDFYSTFLFISEVKPKRLHRPNITTRLGDSSLLGDSQSQLMLNSPGCKVPDSPADKLEGVGSCEIAEDTRVQHQLKTDDSVTSEDKILKAVKFVEQLKALLKLDDQGQMETESDLDVSDSLQVSEVTSSNLNGVADISSGTESEAQIERFKRNDTKVTSCKGELHLAEHHEVKGQFVSDSGSTSCPSKAKRIFSTEAPCDAKKMRLLESDQTGIINKTQMASEKSSLPTTKFSCSICRSRFFSYSQLKRHKRVIHKLYSKTSELSGPKISSMKDLQSYHCTFCLHRVDTVKKLQHHMRSTHNITHKASKLWMKSSKIQSLETLNFFKHNTVDLGANCINIKPEHLECRLCGANFLTYKGYKEHLKKKHNVSFSQSNGNQEHVDAKNKGKKCGKLDLVKGYSKYNGHDVDKIQFSQNCGGGYDSDTNKKCKKCETVFDSVKERREHELKSHGLKVCYEGEQFAFMQIDMKVGTLGKEKNSKASEQKKPIIDTDERFFNKLTKSCKLCSAKYLVFSSLQRHMLKRHNIRAYKLLPFLYKSGKAQGAFSKKTKTNTYFQGNSKKQHGLKASSCSSKKELKKKKSHSVSSRMVEIDSSQLGAPLSVSKVPGKQLDFISEKMGTSPRNLLIYRLEGLGSKLKGSTNLRKSQGETKILVVKVKPSTEKQRNGTESKSPRKEIVNVTGKRGGIVQSSQNTAKSMPCKVIPGTKTTVSPDIAFPLDKPEAGSFTETRAQNIDILLPYKEITPLRNGVRSLSEAERPSDKLVNQTVVSSMGAETVSKLAEREHDKALGMSIKAGNHAADENGIEKFLWSTSFTRKRFSCLICDVSFSGYHIQRKHMLNDHGIRLDNHGNRVSPSPSAKQTGPKGADAGSLTGQPNRNEILSDFTASDCTLPPVSPYENSSMEDGKSQIIDVGDYSQSSTLCHEESGMEDNYELKTLEDGTEVYLCSHCPAHFKSLIDRLIHINDVHKSVSTPLHHSAARSQISSPKPTSIERSSKELGLSKPSSALHSLPDQVSSLKKKITTGKPPQTQSQAQCESEHTSGKKKWIDPPGIYHCHLCENIYKYYKGVYRHVRQFHKEQPLRRSECLIRNNLDARMLSENPQCHLCKKKFRALNYLNTHMKCEHGTEIGNLDTDLSSALSNKRYAKEGMAKTQGDSSARKQNRQIETVKSNLRAISIGDDPPSQDERRDSENGNTSAGAQFDQEEGYIPVPPCDDESEFANEAVQVVENNLFSRLQANLLRSPRPIWNDEPASSGYSAMSDGNKKGRRKETAQQSVACKEKNDDVSFIDVNKAQAASSSVGKMYTFFCMVLSILGIVFKKD